MKKLISLLCILCLTGCHLQRVATKSEFITKKNTTKVRQESKGKKEEKDGAPLGPLPTLFKLLRPKSEPFSRYGNPSEYRIKGRHYEVMPSAKGYRARGTASWYGTKFHSKRTSSGEHYNMYALTAAHRTLPLPTYVRVKNLQNGREAIVKVNDRGPFHSNRLIDLSYAAAAKLGMMPKGTAMVEIEAITPVAKGKQPHTAQYYIQAGAFTSSALANNLKRKLARATSARVFIEHYRQRYIVRIGPFANKRLADQCKQRARKLGASNAFAVLQ